VREAPRIWRLDDAAIIFDRIADSSVRAGTTLRSQNPTPILPIRAALQQNAARYKRGAYFEIPVPAVIATAIKD
jgi:hypothetical protein